MKVTIEEHRAIVEDFIAFMSGGDQRFTKELTARMREASAAMDYEAAAVYRDRLQAIDAVLNKSALVLAEGVDAVDDVDAEGEDRERPPGVGAADRQQRRDRAQACGGEPDDAAICVAGEE